MKVIIKKVFYSFLRLGIMGALILSVGNAFYDEEGRSIARNFPVYFLKGGQLKIFSQVEFDDKKRSVLFLQHPKSSDTQMNLRFDNTHPSPLSVVSHTKKQFDFLSGPALQILDIQEHEKYSFHNIIVKDIRGTVGGDLRGLQIYSDPKLPYRFVMPENIKVLEFAEDEYLMAFTLFNTQNIHEFITYVIYLNTQSLQRSHVFFSFKTKVFPRIVGLNMNHHDLQRPFETKVHLTLTTTISENNETVTTNLVFKRTGELVGAGIFPFIVNQMWPQNKATIAKNLNTPQKVRFIGKVKKNNVANMLVGIFNPQKFGDFHRATIGFPDANPVHFWWWDKEFLEEGHRINQEGNVQNAENPVRWLINLINNEGERMLVGVNELTNNVFARVPYEGYLSSRRFDFLGFLGPHFIVGLEDGELVGINKDAKIFSLDRFRHTFSPLIKAYDKSFFHAVNNDVNASSFLVELENGGLQQIEIKR